VGKNAIKNITRAQADKLKEK